MNIKKVLKFKGNILVTGETGSGKSYWCEQFALQREKLISRVVTVDLAALSESLVESELFGHTRGAFTGANAKRVGLCEQVNDGTLILDEIGELSLEAQKKLLTLLERKVFRPVGSNHEIVFKGKVLAATNRNLREMVKKGQFREDLFYRLNVFHHHITPFRNLSSEQKRAIIKELILKVMKFYHLEQTPIFSDAAKEMFLQNRWPGNIRQISHLLEFLIIMYGDSTITVDTVTKALKGRDIASDTEFNGYGIGSIPFQQAKANFEKGYIKTALLMTEGNVNRVSLLTGMSKSTLISKIRQLDINVLKYKNMQKMDKEAA